MDLHGLRQFLVVARREHLSGAAQELQVAQPSLSRTVARLEAELGVPLFDRAGRLLLNESGRRFRDHVERALGELDAGRRAAVEAAGEGFGQVRLASETFLTVTGALASFKHSHPDTDVELYQMPADEMARALHARTVDWCVASQPVPGEGLEDVHLHEEPVYLAVPPDHRLASLASVTVPQLRDEPFVISRVGHWQRRLLDQLFAAHNLTPRIVCEGDEPAATAVLVSAGLGLTLIPAMALASTAHTPIAWIAIDDPASRRTLTLYRAAGARLSTAAQLMGTVLTTWPWTETAERHQG